MMELKPIKPDELSLDTNNPRFGLSQAQDEAHALEILAETADLKELWDSIAERGFEKFEPLVAVYEGDKLVVLEGNRRLAAVKLLLNPSQVRSEIVRKRIPTISAERLDTCRELPVAIVKDRDEAAGYIGFKHVNGPARWSSLAKAKFGVDLFESLDGQKTPQERMRSLTKQLGDSRGLIIRLLVAYKVVMQAISLGVFDQIGVDQSDIEFSHLYTLINNPDSRAFIGLSRAPLGESMIVDDPIPENYVANLRELLGWLYGPKSVIKSQGVDRPRLQRVLASGDGLRELRTTGSLDAAEAVAGLRNEDWLDILAKASTLAGKASADAAVVSADLSEEDIAQALRLLKRLDAQVRQIRSVFETD
jgi:hypothetical protein